MRVQVGFTSSTDNPGMEDLHRVKAIFCLDGSAPESYGRAKVLVLGDEPRVWRLGGLAVVYGKASPSILNLLRKQAPPVLVSISDGPIGGSKSQQILDRLALAGRTVVNVEIGSGDVGKIVAYDGACEITTVTTGG